MKEVTKEIIFRISEPMMVSEVNEIFNMKTDTNAILLNKEDLVFTAFTADFNLISEDENNLQVLNNDVFIISYRPLRNIDKDIPMYVREKSMKPGQYEEKWRTLNSEELELIKYFMEDIKEATSNREINQITNGYVILDYYSYYKSLLRNEKLNNLGVE
jgi:hypothetical protein